VTGTAEATAAGSLLFARFAFPPNSLGHCGGDDSETLLEYAASGEADGALDRLCGQFEGAMPYLRLIARSAGMKPLDQRVVEAYWLGNGLLGATQPPAFGSLLREGFRGRVNRSEWAWLRDKPDRGAVAHHSFHVLEMLPRVGLLRSGPVGDLLVAANRCLVRPGTVSQVTDDEVIALLPQLEMRDGKLALSEPRSERLARARDGHALVSHLLPGDTIAAHWGWACDRLTTQQTSTLEAVTRRSLRVANLTT
jgi:hypothetical protein